MGEIIAWVSKHVDVVECSVVMCTTWPTSNIICDAVYIVTHNKCTQQIAIFAPTVVCCIFSLRFVGGCIQCNRILSKVQKSF